MFATFIYILSIALYIKAAEVYLTVKTEANTVCSDSSSVMLVCEGVDLEVLRWSYSSPNSTKDMDLKSFLADNSPEHYSIDNNPAFLTVQLIAVSRYPDSNDSANFSSILTFDLLELDNQGITSITCGYVSTFEEKQVTDIIMDLVNTKITANYHIGALTSIDVQLRNLLTCSSIIMYTLIISGLEEVKTMRNCVGPFCEARFSSIRISTKEYTELTLLTTITGNKIISRTFPIGLRSDNYIFTQVNSTNCVYSVGCTVIQEDSTCSIQHTVPSEQPINGMEMLKIPHSIPGTVHKFKFSAMENRNFHIRDNTSFTDEILFGLRSTAILSTTSLYLIFMVIHFLLLLIGAFCKVKVLVYRKKSLVVSMVILLVLLVICISSLFAFGIISYGTQCSQVRMTLHDSMLDTMLVISCLGITILITIWSFIGYGVYKNRKFTLRSENRNTEPNHDLKDAYCETQHKNVHLRQTAANSSSEVPGVNMRSRDGQRKSQYNMLERPLTTRFSHSCDVRNDCYSTVNEGTLIELKLRDAPYKHESRSVPNLTDPSYTHIAKRNSQSISTVPDVVFRSKSENTRDNYDVLSQQSINFQDATNGSRFHSCYEDISEASIEPLGAGLYLHLYHGEKSKPVPSMDDPTYSHGHIEPEVEEPQVKPKRFSLKKTGQCMN